MAKLGRIVFWVLGALLVAVVLAGIAGAVWYASDGVVEADVTERKCSHIGPNTVTVETRMFGITKTTDVAYAECLQVPEDAFVQYHVRTGRTVIFASKGGSCIWDTAGIGPC